MALRELAAFLGGAAQGVGSGLMQREDQKRAERERQDRLAQQEADRLFREAQMELQRQQFAESQRTNEATRTRLAAEEAREAEKFGRDTAREQATQYTSTDVLPDDLVGNMEKYGLRVVRDGMGARRGFKTAEEIAREETERLAAQFEAQGLTPLATALRASGGRLGGVSADLTKTQAERDAERAAEQADRLEQIRVQAAASRPPRDPLKSVVGPDGKVILVPESQAIGMEPAPTGRTATVGSDDQVKTLTLLEEAKTVLRDLSPTAKGFSGAVGAGWQSVPFMGGPPAGSDSAGYKARLDRFKALNVLPRLSVMKGLGQMSNVEFDTVTKASTDLDATLPEADFIRLYNSTIEAVDKAYNRARAGTTIVNDANGDGVIDNAPQAGGRTSGAGLAGQPQNVDTLVAPYVANGYTRDEAVAFLKSKGIIK